MKELKGGCHCGAVRFLVRVREFRVIDCNCTICTKKGFLHLIVDAQDFHLERGGDALREYRTATQIARHLFCGTCGIHAFYRPRSHPEAYDVNVRCLDDVDLSRFEVQPFDGQNWEENIDQIR